MMKNETNLSNLIAENKRNVELVAQQYLNRGLTLEQLIEEGNKGLGKAAEHYDASKGDFFINYAVWYVRQRILYAITGTPIPDDNQLTIRERGILFAIAEGESLKQIAAERGLTEERLRQIIKRINKKILNNE